MFVRGSSRLATFHKRCYMFTVAQEGDQGDWLLVYLDCCMLAHPDQPRTSHPSVCFGQARPGQARPGQARPGYPMPGCASSNLSLSLSLSVSLSLSLSLSRSLRASIAQLVDSRSCLRKALSSIPASATTGRVTKKPLPSKSAEESQP